MLINGWVVQPLLTEPGRCKKMAVATQTTADQALESLVLTLKEIRLCA